MVVVNAHDRAVGENDRSFGILSRQGLSIDLAQSLPSAVYVTDHVGRITFYNEAAAEMWGCRPVLGESEFCGSWKLYRPDGGPMAHSECPMAVALRERRPVRGAEAIAERPDGTRVPFIPYPTPIFDAEGNLLGAINMLVDISERKRAEIAQTVLFEFTDKLYRASGSQDVHEAALDAITRALGCSRASILLGDDAGVMKFVASRGLSEDYRKAVEGHSPWKVGERNPEPIFVSDIDDTDEPASLKAVVKGEGIRGLAFIPLLVSGAVVGKFMAYHAKAHEFTPEETRVALTIARQLGFSIERLRADEKRKEAEKLQQLLISELNHRVKNTLATVSAIATQTVRAATSPGEFATSFTGRLQALGQTHTLLTDNNWRGTDILTLVRDQLLVGGVEDDRISYAGPAVPLDPQLALHLSLVLYELGTNARKYGALSMPRGELALRWTLRSEGKMLDFEWRERNGPPVNQPTRKGFGSKLIEQSINSRGGEVTIRYEPDGLVCAINLTVREEGGPRVPLKAHDKHRIAPAQVRREIKGARVLIVEDEPLVAFDIVSILTEAGCEVIGPAASLATATDLIKQADFDVALLDANLDGQGVEELAHALDRSNVPFAFLTGYSREGLPSGYKHVPMVQKPFMPGQLLELIGTLGNA